jgi:internalin A
MSEPPPKLVRIFISSPSDVAEERKAAAELIEQELAKRAAFRDRLKLDPFRYNDPHSDTPFLADLSAQASVDQRLRSGDAEIVVAILWARMGTPVRDPSDPAKILYQSGTEQEIEEALQAGKEVLVYFRRGAAVLPDDDERIGEFLEQRRQVRAFRARLEDSGRGVNDYQDVADFRRKLEQHLDQLLTRIRDASLGPVRQVTTAPEPTWAGDPYPGLRSFEPEEAPIFFGRREETAELVRWVAEESRRFVAVVGVSGSGKSSLVKAGLIPALRGWPSAIVRLIDAGGDPFRALAIRLEPHLPPSRRPVFRSDPAKELADPGWIDAVLDEKPASSCLLIVIDQFEELQTAVAENLRTPFIALLKAITENHRMRIVVSVRADFLGALSHDETLARLFSGNSFVLHPPGAAALRAIVREPARLAGVAVEDPLIDKLAEAARLEPSALPLLAFVLEWVYRRRAGGGLALPAVSSSTELSTILSPILIEYTEEVEYALPAEQREALPQFYSYLVRIEDGGLTRRRCRPTDIAEDATLIALRDRLINARLLATLDDPAEGVELAHEVLFQAWPRLRSWVTANTPHLLAHRASRAPSRQVATEPEAVWTGDPYPDSRPSGRAGGERNRSPSPRSTGEPPRLGRRSRRSKWYVSYAWADDRTHEGLAREKIVDRLCDAAGARGHAILRDKDVLSPGDEISQFMRRLGSGDRIFIILSEKYLHSPHCMFELSEVRRTSRQEGKAFLERVRIYALPDANISEPTDWADLAIFWKHEYEALESRACEHGPMILGELGLRRLRQMYTFYTQVADIVGTLADIVRPRTFEELEHYGFDDLPA